MIDNRFWGKQERVGYLCNKTGFLYEQFDDTSPVPVPENIQEAGDFPSVMHDLHNVSVDQI
jgi:hypothetical protein